MGDIRYAACGGNFAKVVAKYSLFQLTAGSYGLWVDFQVATPDGAAVVQWMWAASTTSITDAGTITFRVADAAETLDSNCAITVGAAAAAPATDAPAISANTSMSSGWTRGVWVPSTRVLQIWHATANKDLTLGMRILEARVGDRGHSLLGGRFHV